MIAIGRYIVFILSVAGMTLSVDHITEKEREDFLQYIFNLHNEYRKIHGVQPLMENDEMSKLAVRTLRNVTSKKAIQLPNGYGFNFTYKPLTNETKLDYNSAKQIVLEWYNTGVGYNYDLNPTNNDADDFTQIVWAKTTELGLGILQYGDINQYAVLALYSPQGNQKNEFVNNVIRPRS